MAKRIYVAATRQNHGKTVVSVGLLSALLKRFDRVGYIKPVGQQFRLVDGVQVDKDAILMKTAYKLEENWEDMSPIAVPQGFTQNYILHGDPQVLRDKVLDAFNRVAKDKEIVVIEGTGHAGVGSVFDMSNAQVARLLKAQVVLVTSGGIGQPIDEIVLNKPTFDMEGVRIVGAIINKVLPQKFDKIDTYVRKGLEKKDIEVLGVVPFNPVLSSPTVAELLEDIGGKLLYGEKHLDNSVTKVIVGAMPPHEALPYFGPGTLLITPGNREDNILAAIGGCLGAVTKTYCVSGILATCGFVPHESVLHLMERVPIPLISVKDDTYTAASRIHSLITKIRPNDTKKIRATERLIQKHVDIDRLLSLIDECPD
jgi:BioD-like phosphotransacetylase family protein